MHTSRHLGRKFPAFALVVTALLFVVWVDARGQDALKGKDALSAESFIKPPKVILDAITAARPEENQTFTNISPDGKKFLLVKNDGMPSVDRMGRPCVHLGELAIDHTANRSHALYVRSSAGYELYFHADRRKIPVEVPTQARVSNAAWSPDGTQLAFFGHFLDSTHIFVADTTTGKSRQITKTPVLATLITTFQWSRDGKRIQTVLVPSDGAGAPRGNDVSTGPKVRLALEGKTPSRTVRYLLETPEEMQLLEHFATGQLAFVDIESGKVTRVGAPSMLKSVNMSPGGDQFRVTVMKKPFSYYVATSKFGTHESIWDAQGSPIYTMAERKLQEPQPQAPVLADPAAKGKGFQGGKKGGKGKGAQPPTQPPATPGDAKGNQPPADPDAKRDIGWRPDGAGMSYLQLEPANATDEKAVRKDRVMHWLPPYGKDDAKVVYETPHRIDILQYSDDCKLLFLTQTIDNERQVIAVDLADPKQPTYILHKGSAGDAKGGDGKGDEEWDSPYTPLPSEFPDYVYDDYPEQQKKGGKGGFGAAAASNLMTRSNKGEAQVVRISTTGDVYLAGTDKSGGALYSKPYIDKVNIKTSDKTRIFSGKPDVLETIDAVDGDDIKLVFTTRQKKDLVPNSYLTDLSNGKSDRLTENADHSKWFRDLKVEKIQVTRADGFKFWITVTRSPNAQGRQPAIFWIYPREYADQAAYDKGGANKGKGDAKFAAPAVRSMSMLTLLDYTVVEPDVPIVGPAGRMNDNYVGDLRNSLAAVIDELDKRGLIDRERLACGGHSYGAFSTANAMAHTPFFKAGIAGDGCYNRTLTPMSFQSEKRYLWEARETYLEMSPLLWADRMNGALLMYHGVWDQNEGTHPINSERLYMALRGLGKPVALYMYNYEDHGPIARETNLDLWARWVAWLDMYVKNPQKKN
jgi:dipeptidyl aminopeptidase/acylaminoacyl peptidase